MKTIDPSTGTISKPPSTAPQLPVSPSARLRWFAEGELCCKGPGCASVLPAGFYGNRKVAYYCCGNCQYRFGLSLRQPIKCTFCGQLFVKKGKAPTKPFCSAKHFHQWRQQQLDREKAGRFTALLHEYIDEVAPRNYAASSLNAIRCDLAAFFDFLNRSKIRSLNSVEPKIVSAFLADLAKRRPKSAGSLAGQLRLFFDWLIFEGRRKKANPVISSIHSGRAPKRLPRPFSSSDLDIIWGILEGQPNVALRLAVALGQESALRIGEVANIRLEDVDLYRQEIFVRLPNKTGSEHVVPFHSKTKQYIQEWLVVRGKRDFDFLFVGPSGRPMSSATLRNLLNKLFKVAIPRWCFHRLRHVAASTLHRGGADGTTVMNTFGWKSPAVMEGYTEVRSAQLRESYDRAFSAQEEHSAGSVTTRSMGEFFANEERPITSDSK